MLFDLLTCSTDRSTSIDMANNELLVVDLADSEDAMLVVAHDRQFLAVLRNRMLELTPQRRPSVTRGYAEYVTSTRHEASRLYPGG